MASALDQQYEAVLGVLTGEGGMLQIAETEDGRKYVSNFPPTLPGMFDAFAVMNGQGYRLKSTDGRTWHRRKVANRYFQLTS